MESARDMLRRELPGVVEIRQATDEELADLDASCKPRQCVQERAVSKRRSASDERIIQEWATFLSPHFGVTGSLHFTGTYSDDYGYSHGLMLARNVVKDFYAFYRTLKRPAGEAVAIGVESHPSGRAILHLHALLGGSWSPADRAQAAGMWVAHRGWARATEIVGREGCVAYAAKHLLKQGTGKDSEFDFRIPTARNGSRRERQRARGDAL